MYLFIYLLFIHFLPFICAYIHYCCVDFSLFVEFVDNKKLYMNSKKHKITNRLQFFFLLHLIVSEIIC